MAQLALGLALTAAPHLGHTGRHPPAGAVSQQKLCPQEEYAWFLVVVSVFKNEADVLKEWIEHHLWQGVEHFYLVDNGSTDDYMRAIGSLATRVTVIANATKYAQVDHLNSLLQLAAGRVAA